MVIGEINEIFRKYKSDKEIFHNLMPLRAREILLVAPAFDAFTLEQDGLLTEKLFDGYYQLNMSNPPRVTNVSTVRGRPGTARQPALRPHHRHEPPRPGEPLRPVPPPARGGRADSHLPAPERQRGSGDHGPAAPGVPALLRPHLRVERQPRDLHGDGQVHGGPEQRLQRHGHRPHAGDPAGGGQRPLLLALPADPVQRDHEADPAAGRGPAHRQHVPGPAHAGAPQGDPGHLLRGGPGLCGAVQGLPALRHLGPQVPQGGRPGPGGGHQADPGHQGLESRSAHPPPVLGSRQGSLGHRPEQLLHQQELLHAGQRALELLLPATSASAISSSGTQLGRRSPGP